MNENILKDVLAEIYEEEISALNNLPQFKTSLRHRIVMKHIFSLFEKNKRKSVNAPLQIVDSRQKPLRLRNKLVLILALIICAALLTGFIVVFVSKNFSGTVYSDNTHLFAVNTENCTTTIEHKYYLPDLPKGFELIESDSSSFDVYTLYQNNETKQTIALSQYTKNHFKPHYDTEHHNFEDVEINGRSGLCIDFSDDEHYCSMVVWDNNDYILELFGDLSKNQLIELAKTSKISENIK